MGKALGRFMKMRMLFNCKTGERNIYLRKGGKLLAKDVDTLLNKLGLPFLPIYASTIPTITTLFSNLQLFVKNNNNITLWKLFESIYPNVSTYYKEAKDYVTRDIKRV